VTGEASGTRQLAGPLLFARYAYPPTAQRAIGGIGFLDDLVAGEWVSLHWEWVGDRLTPR
jgi:hypothetical protein